MNSQQRSTRRCGPRAVSVALVACFLGIDRPSAPNVAQGVPVAAARETVAATRETAVTDPLSIEQWVRELDDNRFVTRRNATERLILAGTPAIGPLMQALGGGNLEVATRGVHVLKALALSKDFSTQEAAVAALRDLAKLPRGPAARQAGTAIAALGEVRQQRAIKELEELGARIGMNERMAAFAPVLGLGVEIGPEWQGTVNDLQRFQWLPDVREVSFVGRQVTDEWIRSIEYLQGVEQVLIKYANISNEAVKSISRLKRVTKVDLMYTPIDDAAIAYLKDMKTVREVRLYGTGVSREAVEQYQTEVANVVVDFKMGAFLGVMCQQAPFPCQVVEVVADSAAARGGIEIQDYIVRYGGNPVSNFDELRKLIGKNKVGDTVLIQVARGGRPLVGIVEQRGSLALGAEVEAAGFGCKVRKLSPDGAAAKAGLRANDVIAELNGEAVNTPEKLTTAFAALPADSRLEFRVLRNSRIASVPVTFGEWTDTIR